MIGDLVTCKWLNGSVCIALEYEVRAFYKIYKVYDFTACEYYWVDEADLEKL
jgi:hypothetical protein